MQTTVSVEERSRRVQQRQETPDRRLSDIGYDQL